MKKIEDELLRVFKVEAGKLGRPISWFRFAKKTKTGAWRFLANKEAQWNALEKIAKKLSTKFPGYTMGEIVDILAGLINS